MGESSHKKPTLGQVLLGLGLIILFYLVAVWVGTWAWNGSMPKMFSGTKSITYGTMASFLILLIIVGGLLCRPSLLVVKKE